jgi:hypothetical protein
LLHIVAIAVLRWCGQSTVTCGGSVPQICGSAQRVSGPADRSSLNHPNTHSCRRPIHHGRSSQACTIHAASAYTVAYHTRNDTRLRSPLHAQIRHRMRHDSTRRSSLLTTRPIIFPFHPGRNTPQHQALPIWNACATCCVVANSALALIAASPRAARRLPARSRTGRDSRAASRHRALHLSARDTYLHLGVE